MLGGVDAEAMRRHPLFRTLQDQGILPAGEGDLDAWEAVEAEETDLAAEGTALPCTLKVTGMWCPSCAWVIEHSLRKRDGVVQATASFSSDRLRVSYVPGWITPEEIAGAVSALGYGVEASEGDPVRERALRAEFLRLGVSLFLTANVMMISFGLYQGYLVELSETAVRMLGLPIFLMSTVVVFYGGFPILERAVKAARQGGFVMETLIGIGALAAYGLSVYGFLLGSLHLYFDTACMLVSLILVGKFLESRIRHRATRGVEEIYELLPGKARVRTEQGDRFVSIEAVRPGDRIRVRAGEVIPADGVVLEGAGEADEAQLTGEPLSRPKGSGDTVLGGSTLLEGDLVAQVTGAREGSAIGRMIALMENALLTKNTAERLTDRLMAFFAPLVILTALAVGVTLVLRGAGLEQGLVRAITVLVIACPCALGIATPLARVAAIGRARREGILVADGDALEGAHRLTVVVIDKTGTATQGTYRVVDIRTNGAPEIEVMSLAASVESGFEHPVARAVRAHASSLGADTLAFRAREAVQGRGVRGRVRGERVAVGSEAFLRDEGVALPEGWSEQALASAREGWTAVYVARGVEAVGMILLGDSLRPDMPGTVKTLEASGMEVHLVSGDSPQATARVARDLGGVRFEGGALPGDKVEWVQRLQRAGHRVGMVGDGANDAAALAVADVGFATGEALSVTRHASDLTLLRFSGARLLAAIDLSRLTARTVITNLSLALLYNLLALPAAVMGWVNPVVAVTAMLLSSLTVVGNSARIVRASGPGDPAPGR